MFQRAKMNRARRGCDTAPRIVGPRVWGPTQQVEVITENAGGTEMITAQWAVLDNEHLVSILLDGYTMESRWIKTEQETRKWRVSQGAAIPGTVLCM